MKVPSSFYAFQRLFEEVGDPTNALREINTSPPSKKKQDEASYFCDQIMSTVFTHENLRDAIVDSRYNSKNNSVLLLLNPEMDDPSELVELIGSMSAVAGVVYNEKEGVKAIKVVSKSDADFNMNNYHKT